MNHYDQDQIQIQDRKQTLTSWGTCRVKAQPRDPAGFWPSLAAFLAFVALGFVAVALAAGTLAGCAPSREACNQIEVGAAAFDGNVAAWKALSDDEREESYWQGARAFADVNWSINGKAVPERYQSDPFAERKAARKKAKSSSATSSAETERR